MSLGARKLAWSGAPAKLPPEEEEKRVRIASYDGANDEMTLEHVPSDEMEGVIKENSWFGVEGGRPQFIPKYKPIPEQIDDEQLLPFWNGEKRVKDIKWDEMGYSPCIMIQSLCGYNYTPERYEESRKILEGWGFRCMRSKRGKDGCYWEIWMLFGDWSAEGKLEAFIKTLPEKDTEKSRKERMEKIISWITNSLPWGYGTLDIVSQRWAMAVD